LFGHTLICRLDGLLTDLCVNEFHVGCCLSCCCTDAPDCLEFLLSVAFDRCEFLGSLLPFAAPALPAPGLICLAFTWVPNLLPNAACLSSQLLRRRAPLSSQPYPANCCAALPPIQPIAVPPCHPANCCAASPARCSSFKPGVCERTPLGFGQRQQLQPSLVAAAPLVVRLLFLRQSKRCVNGCLLVLPGSLFIACLPVCVPPPLSSRIYQPHTKPLGSALSCSAARVDAFAS
jgi:hypothetical protein